MRFICQQQAIFQKKFPEQIPIALQRHIPLEHRMRLLVVAIESMAFRQRLVILFLGQENGAKTYKINFLTFRKQPRLEDSKYQEL